MIFGVWRFAAFAAFALLVAACTSGGAADGSFTPTSTYTPPSYSTAPPTSTSPAVATTGPNVRPGEKPPKLRAVGRTDTPAGARAFGDYWMKALDWGYATTDSGLARSLFNGACHGCARFVRSEFDQQARADRHYIGGRLEIIGVTSAANDNHNGATAVVDVTVDQAKGRLVAAGGQVVRVVPSISGDISRVWLRWNSQRWTVVDWKGVVQE